LLAVLDPDVVVRADAAAVAMGADALVRGADAVSKTFAGRARAARLALVDHAPAAIWMQQGETKAVFSFSIRDGRIVGIDLVMDAETIAAQEMELLDR
jgi:RNA polymerase sigma-70 factor (ECF subfamily)